MWEGYFKREGKQDDAGALAARGTGLGLGL